jgi:hypothetical protein
MRCFSMSRSSDSDAMMLVSIRSFGMPERHASKIRIAGELPDR